MLAGETRSTTGDDTKKPVAFCCSVTRSQRKNGEINNGNGEMAMKGMSGNSPSLHWGGAAGGAQRKCRSIICTYMESMGDTLCKRFVMKFISFSWLPEKHTRTRPHTPLSIRTECV